MSKPIRRSARNGTRLPIRYKELSSGSLATMARGVSTLSNTVSKQKPGKAKQAPVVVVLQSPATVTPKRPVSNNISLNSRSMATSPQCSRSNSVIAGNIADEGIERQVRPVINVSDSIESQIDNELARLSALKIKMGRVNEMKGVNTGPGEKSNNFFPNISQVRKESQLEADHILSDLGVLPVDDAGDFEEWPGHEMPKMSSMEDFVKSSGTKVVLKSGIHESSGGAVQRQVIWPHSMLGAKFLPSMDSKIIYHDLDERLLTIGELSIIKSGKISESERVARIEILEDILFNVPHFEWSALLRFHATILSGIEKGLYKFGDDFSSLGNQILRPYPKRRAVVPKPLPIKAGEDTRVFFCKDYNKGSCSMGDKHSTSFNGKKFNVRHICAKCWLKNKVQNNHPESSVSCPLSDS